MSPNQKFENIKPFGPTPSISRLANACQILSKSEEDEAVGAGDTALKEKACSDTNCWN